MEQGGKMAHGWAARDASGLLSPYSFSRRVQGDDDVTIKVLFCGICHTDLHIIKNEWGNAMYPVVPGHEVVGVVTDVGHGVSKFKAGDTVGVGYFVDSCRSCESCSTGHENYCPDLVLSSNGVDHQHHDGGASASATTKGGFSDVLVVSQDFVVRVPESLPPDGAAPLLCAGVTVYSPMVQYALNGPGKHLGVVGLGGLGHLAVKFGKAFGMTVTVISSSPAKREEALGRLGADAFLVSHDASQMKAAAATMDGIIDTVSAGHQIVPLLALLKPMGQMVVVGAPSTPLELPAYAIITGGKRVAGNGVGSVADCQAMLDFAAEHGVTADTEVVPMDYVNTAIERLEKNDVRYRFVVDVAGSQMDTVA
ncbi:putative cinnamyl alcohol dehydrogenase 8D [Zea mays]|uniref:Probable cinnamyl alcohol dehydrogenase n=1 Tax=Zea mays TaxID=4577 RepID=A0A3L6DW50_MAIZE|nr:putative cinnamyl alcohol dehydrogenase 8D [Zea mays]